MWQKKSMSLKLDEDVFSCHCAGGNGGMLDLYKKLNNCYDKSNGDVIREIKAKLNINDDYAKNQKISKPIPQVKKLSKNEVLPHMQKADKAIVACLICWGYRQNIKKTYSSEVFQMQTLKNICSEVYLCLVTNISQKMLQNNVTFKE